MAKLGKKHDNGKELVRSSIKTLLTDWFDEEYDKLNPEIGQLHFESDDEHPHYNRGFIKNGPDRAQFVIRGIIDS